ncbi:intracellular protein transport protein USO1-like isoform X2 [Xenia sp. Carnegie-2017]|uniref:intracellular protein transport protein USO1-like isoform X2 n=1 Tax=Xenia sp. Carnegie-2017 TaxID=2897299 RepID=UPI001F03CEF3|nr:intracellular protein transport protein USO1-like isoform X2 [Xenia sp. Carnegie-2017]
MDPIYIVGGLVAILILVLFLAYFVFFKEQTFEDAVANQKAVGDIFSSGKNASNKTGVRHRKKVKKERPKSEEESELLVGKGEELLQSVAPITNISFEDEAKSLFEASPDKSTVVENSEDDKTVQKPKKKSRDKRKSDHRNEMTLPSKEQEAIIEKNEIVVEDIMVNSNVEEVLESLPPMPEELPPKEGSPGGPVASSKKSKKSKGGKEKQVNADSSNLNDILEKLDTASLNRSEIQKLVDVLFDKQKSADEWKKSGGKPNPIDLLQKKLNNKEEALKDEYLRAENLAVKVKELREENVENITKYKAAETSALQKIKTLEKENEALQLRMNASQERNALEQEKLIAALQTSKETSNKEDLASTKELLKNLESQKSEMQAQIEALEKDINSKKENEAKLRQQAAEANELVKNFDLVKNSLTKELKEAVKSKQDSEHRLEVAKKDLDAAHAEKSTYIQQANTLKSELDEEKTKKCELEKMFNAIELKMKEASDNHNREKEDFMKQLESHGKKDQVQVVELQKQSEDTLKQLEEMKQKLNQSEKDHENTKKDFVNQGAILTKQEAEINDLKCSNNSKDEKIELLTKTLNERKEEIIVVKNDVSQELNSAPQDDTKVKELEEQIEKLTGELNENKTQIATWEKSIETMTAKNNELREKNWKAMDALSTAEKQRDVDIKKALSSVKEENQQTVKSLHESIKIYLCQIHPTLSVDKDLPYEKFLEIYQNELNVNESSSNDAKVKKLEEHLEMLTKEKDRTDVEYNQCKETIKIKESKLNEALKQKEDIDNQFNKYKTLLSATETMLRDLEANVEKEIAELKVSKNTELEKKNSLIDDLKKKYEKACDESKSKDGDIASLKTALAKKEGSADKDLEKEKLLSTLEELKQSLKKAEEDVKSKEVKICALESDATSKDSDIKKVNASLAQLKENITNVNNECKLKDSEAKSLRLELSTLKVAAATASNESTKERKRLLDEIEGLKAERKSLSEKVEVKEREMKEIKEENKSSELEKYKTEASDAAKVNAALRKELEEVRLQKSGSETPKKKHDKEMEAKLKSLEDKLAHSVKRESELQAQIAHMEDSTSIDDDVASDSKEKKKKSGLKGLLGSKSKYESKFRDLNEKYEHLKAESDAKTSKIAELETELQAQEKKNNELTTQVALSNGGVQNTGKALSESQVKQMAEAMTEADQTGSV